MENQITKNKRGRPRKYFTEEDYIQSKRDKARKYNAKVLRWKKSLLAASGCVLCGWNENPAGLIFHHRNQDEKSFNVQGTNKGMVLMRVEIAKCDVICRNCHAVHHYGLV